MAFIVTNYYNELYTSGSQDSSVG